MKRLALVLAAAVLGSGCIVVDDDEVPVVPTGTLDVAWSFIRTLNDAGSSTVTYGCASAGIDTVRVSAPSRSVVLPCADAYGDGGLAVLPAGTQNIVVTAYRGGTGGVALYSSQFNGVTIGTNQTTSLTAPLYGYFDQLQINANFQNLAGTISYPTCASAGVTTYSFHLVDSANTTVYSSGNFPCSDPPGIVFDTSNPVDLDQYTIRVVGFGPVYDFDSAVYPTCGSPVFSHYGNDVDFYAWNLPVYDVTPVTS